MSYDISHTVLAKSDQLNAADIPHDGVIIKIRGVRVTSDKQQPVHVFFNGDDNRPWKPNLGTRRFLLNAWGADASKWIGRSVQLYNDKDVIFKGEKSGGIRIKAMSHIPVEGLDMIEVKNRMKRDMKHIAHLEVKVEFYPDELFESQFENMKAALQSGKSTLMQVVTYCEKSGALTDSQLERLKQVTPINTEEENEGNE